MVAQASKVRWSTFQKLAPYPHIAHGVFSRHGGVSEGPFAGLNVGEGVGDFPQAVQANREQIRAALDLDHLVFPTQHHGTNVQRVTQKNLGKVLHADALFTTEKRVGLAVTHADCQAILFYDPVHEVVAVAHAGWRGTVQNISAQVIEALRRDVGTQSHNLFVCISPSLGPDHSEFKNYKQEIPESLWSFQVKPLYFDFWAIAKKQLLQCGVLEKNIEIAQVCTFCHRDYYSYRREKETGRNATVIALKE